MFVLRIRKNMKFNTNIISNLIIVISHQRGGNRCV